jgi:hypothetical protein
VLSRDFPFFAGDYVDYSGPSLQRSTVFEGHVHLCWMDST